MPGSLPLNYEDFEDRLERYHHLLANPSGDSCSTSAAILERVLGRKRFFLTCLTIFTVSSLLCGVAPSLGAIIIFRVLQGAGGGGLQPMAQAILADNFPADKRALAFALYGVTVIVAPTIWADTGRRLDHRQLFLALDFLH